MSLIKDLIERANATGETIPALNYAADIVEMIGNELEFMLSTKPEENMLLPGVVRHHATMLRDEAQELSMPTTYPGIKASKAEQTFEKKRLLAAAAEDLLAACKAVRNSLESTDLHGICLWIEPPFQISGVHESAWERLEAAIAKAEGRQP